MVRGRVVARLRHRLAARRILRSCLDKEPELKGARILRCHAAKRSRLVFSGRLDGRPVIFKMIRDSKTARKHTEALAAELESAWPRMSDGPLRVPEPIAFYPASGIAVLGWVPGRTVRAALPGLDDAGLRKLAAAAADWMALYTAERRRRVPFASEFWIRQRASRLSLLAEGADQAAARRLLVSLKMQAAALHHREVTQVAPHGDLSGDNMIWDGATLTAIDMLGGGKEPLARDAARLLVRLAIRAPGQGPFRFGIRADLVEPVERQPLLASEPEGMLRFFIGIELAQRLQEEARFPALHAETHQAIARYLSGPE